MHNDLECVQKIQKGLLTDFALYCSGIAEAGNSDLRKIHEKNSLEN